MTNLPTDIDKQIKGQKLFEDFLKKASICSLATGKEWYPAMLAVRDAREAVENYFNPKRDNKGRFIGHRHRRSVETLGLSGHGDS